MEEIDFNTKIWNINKNLQNKIIFYTKPALKYRTRVILTISNLILKNQIRLS